MRLAEKPYGFKRNLAGVYGFSHSSAEAVQQVRFLQGDYVPDKLVWPLIAPAQSMATLLAKPHEPSDLYIVELSSAKRISINGECIQLNYLYRRHDAFFNDKPRTRAFWALATQGDQNAIDDFIAQSGVALAPEDFEFLRKLRYGLTTADELCADVRFLLDALPEVLFVTHVDAAKPDGNLIESRSDFISLVKSVVQAEGGTVYDPTGLMRDFGQQNAIEDHSEGLAHFTEDFSTAVFADWYKQHIFPLIEGRAFSAGTDAAKANLTRGLWGLLHCSPVSKVGALVETTLEVLGPSSDLVALQSRCLARTGNAAQELEVLRTGLKDYPDNLEMLEQFVTVGLENQLGLQAFDALQAYLETGAQPPVSLINTLAKGLESENHLSQALACVKIANAALPETADIVAQMARLALALADDPGIEQCKTILTGTSLSIDPVLSAKILLWKTRTDDFKTFLHQQGGIPLSDFFPVLSFLDEHGQESQIARAIATYATLNPEILNHVVTKRIFEKWRDNLQSDLSRSKQLALLEQILQLDPEQPAARKAFASLQREIQVQVRALIKAEDIDGLEQLADEVAKLSPPLIEYYLFRSRYYFKQKQWELAQAAAQEITRTTPDHIISWLTIMRCAFLLQDYATVDLAARNFIDLAGPEREKQVDEAHKRLALLPKLCLQAARQDPDPFNAWRLAEISAQDQSLAEKSAQVFRINERKIIARAQELADSGSDIFANYCARAFVVLPDNAQLLRIAGQYYLARDQYEQALPYWNKLAALRPDDPVAIAKAKQCRETLPLAQAS